MKKLTFISLICGLLLSAAACRNNSRMANYERMIDSIRKAEAARELLKTDDDADPVVAFFDSLSYRPLPLRYSASFVDYLPQMKKVPSVFNGRFDYESNIELLAMRMPSREGHKVMMVAEKLDSTSTTLYLCTMNSNYVLVDRLPIYEQKVVGEGDDMGLMRTEFYITSDYEITLVRVIYNTKKESGKEESARRYIINKEGSFEEVIIEL